MGSISGTDVRRCYWDWCDIGSISEVGGTCYRLLEVLVRFMGHDIYIYIYVGHEVLVGMVGHEILVGLVGHWRY